MQKILINSATNKSRKSKRFNWSIRDLRKHYDLKRAERDLDTKEWIPVEQIATKFQLSTSGVKMLAYKGLIRAFRGRSLACERLSMHVNVRDVREYLKNRPKRGRKPKARKS